MISIFQASRDWNYQRGRSRWGKRTDVGRNCRGSEEKKKSKVIGKKKQEVFSGRPEKTGHKEAS